MTELSGQFEPHVTKDEFGDPVVNGYPLGKDYVTLYRGREHFWTWDLPKKESDLNRLGMHWTTNPDVAKHFAVGHNDPDQWDDESEKESTEGKTWRELGGHVVTARVHKSHIIERGSPEWHKVGWENGILDVAYDGDPKNFTEQDKQEMEKNTEKEVTLREGAPVYVTNIVPVKLPSEVIPHISDTIGYDESNPTRLTSWGGLALIDKETIKEGGYIKKGLGRI